MLQFNGRPLPRGVGLIGYTVSSPQTQQRTIDIPEARGVTRTGSKLGARNVTIEYTLLGDSVRQNGEIFHELNKWCYSEGYAPLILPGMENAYLEAECQAYPSPAFSYGDDGSNQIAFFCYRPEFITVAQYSGSIADRLVIAGNISTPVRFDLTVAAALTDPEFTIAGKTIGISGTLDAGTLVIDTEFGTVLSNGDSIASRLTLESEPYVMAPPGELALSFPSGVTGTASWHNRIL